MVCGLQAEEGEEDVGLVGQQGLLPTKQDARLWAVQCRPVRQFCSPLTVESAAQPASRWLEFAHLVASWHAAGMQKYVSR